MIIGTPFLIKHPQSLSNEDSRASRVPFQAKSGSKCCIKIFNWKVSKLLLMPKILKLQKGFRKKSFQGIFIRPVLARPESEHCRSLWAAPSLHLNYFEHPDQRLRLRLAIMELCGQRKFCFSSKLRRLRDQPQNSSHFVFLRCDLVRLKTQR